MGIARNPHNLSLLVACCWQFSFLQEKTVLSYTFSFDRVPPITRVECFCSQCFWGCCYLSQWNCSGAALAQDRVTLRLSNDGLRCELPWRAPIIHGEPRFSDPRGYCSHFHWIPLKSATRESQWLSWRWRRSWVFTSRCGVWIRRPTFKSAICLSPGWSRVMSTTASTAPCIVYLQKNSGRPACICQLSESAA